MGVDCVFSVCSIVFYSNLKNQFLTNDVSDDSAMIDACVRCWLLCVL